MGKKRSIKGISHKKDYRGKFVAVLFGLALAMSGSTSGFIEEALGQAHESVEIVQTRGSENDEYEYGVPAITEDGQTIILDEDTLGFVDEEPSEDDGRTTIYTIDATGNTVKVTVSNEYLDEVATMSMEEVEELSENVYEVVGIEVNVRSSPEISEENGIGVVYAGEHLLGANDRVIDDNSDKEWVPVIYKDKEGKAVRAYVSSEFIMELNKPDLELDVRRNESEEQSHRSEKVDEIMRGVKPNRNGSLTGIDVSAEASPEDLRRILQSDNGITESVTYASGGTFDTSDSAGRINYVYIEIGAASYATGDPLAQGNANYIEQARVCEELGIPYAFYYFSQALSPEEAEREVKDFREKLDEFKNQVGNTDYMVMPHVLNIETSSATPYRVNGHNVTDAAIHWMRRAKEEGLGEVILYTTVWDIGYDEDSIINIDRMNEVLGERVPVWIVGMRSQGGGIKQVDAGVQNKINELAKHTDIVMKQSMIDCKNTGQDGPAFDIDDVDVDVFEKLISLNAEKAKKDIGIDKIFGEDDDER